MITIPEKRPATIFARVSTINKEYLRSLAKAVGMNEGPFINEFISAVRNSPDAAKILTAGNGNGSAKAAPKKAKKSASKKKSVPKKRK